MVSVLHTNFISCRVSFVLRCFYKSNSSCLCSGENGKPFCLAELWPCTNTRRRSKILDLNACHILTLQIPLLWRFSSKKSMQIFKILFRPAARARRTACSHNKKLNWKNIVGKNLGGVCFKWLRLWMKNGCGCELDERKEKNWRRKEDYYSGIFFITNKLLKITITCWNPSKYLYLYSTY